MKRPEDLPQITDHLLRDLTADQAMKTRILQRAARETYQPDRPAFRRTLPAACFAVAARLLLVFLLTGKTALPSVTEPGEITVFTAGSVPDSFSDADTASESGFFAGIGIEPERIVSIEIEDTTVVSDRQKCFDIADLLNRQAIPARLPDESSVRYRTAGFVTDDGTRFACQVCEPYLKSDSLWSCAAFFDAIRQETQN